MNNTAIIEGNEFTVRQIQSRLNGENGLDYMTRGGVVHLTRGDSTYCAGQIGVKAQDLKLVNCLSCFRILKTRINILQGIK